jgi:hypothetical protein
MYKKIVIDRFGQEKPLTLKSGDKYDSTAYIQSPDDKTLYKHPYANTDFTSGYAGGILAEGFYGGVVGTVDRVGKDGKTYQRKDIWLYQRKFLGQIDNRLDLTPEMVTVPSLIPNPNHGNKPILQWVKIHWGGFERDGSQGCITLHPGSGTNFFDYFSIGDSCEIIVNRSSIGKAPDFYGGK